MKKLLSVLITGIVYNLGMTENASAETLEKLANEVFAPVQGDN